LCYLSTAGLSVLLKKRGLAIAAGILLVGYWALLTFVPVPGVGAGNYQEGLNLANYVDARYLPLNKYDGDHDPEGLLSTLPAISTCLLGAWAGMVIRKEGLPAQDKVYRLLINALVMLILGYLWSVQFPLIKKIWTSSYALVTAGYSTLFLAVFYQLIEISGTKRWSLPFIWIGRNSITIYLLGGVLTGALYLARSRLGSQGTILDVVLSMAYLGLIIGAAYVLHRKRWYIRL
jgi:predicted acyltransferase